MKVNVLVRKQNMVFNFTHTHGSRKLIFDVRQPQTPFTRYNRLWNRLNNLFDNQLDEPCEIFLNIHIFTPG